MPNKGNPVVLAANSSKDIQTSCVSGFLCTAGGTLTLSKLDNTGATVIVNALAVTAGEWVDIPIKIGTGQLRAATASDAAGVLVTG
jgi:hypothetical protein